MKGVTTKYILILFPSFFGGWGGGESQHIKTDILEIIKVYGKN